MTLQWILQLLEHTQHNPWCEGLAMEFLWMHWNSVLWARRCGKLRVFGFYAAEGHVLCRVIPHVLPLKKHVNLPEGWSLHVLPVPALPHQVIDLPRTVPRLRQVYFQIVIAVEVTTVFDHLFIGHVVIWLFSGERQDLPQCNRKRPDVALGWKLALQIC